MRLRNWLLTGTSVAVLALAPATAARAQSADLLTAYQAYAAAQAAGDQSATDAALAPLTELCIVEGYASVEACIAAVQSAGGGQAPADATPRPRRRRLRLKPGCRRSQGRREAKAAAEAQAARRHGRGRRKRPQRRRRRGQGCC